MFAYRKAVFPAPMATGVHRLRNKWLSLLSLLVNNYCDNSADNMQLRLAGGNVGVRRLGTRQSAVKGHGQQLN